ncbi:hypothetical protein BGZ52_008566, partial [Haplosporangium bisporale]
IFIVARVLTTRGFAAFRPGINLRAIVTWLAVVSLTLMVIYSALLARLLFTQSMAGSYQGPKAPITLYDPPSSDVTNMTWPLIVEFQDMSVNKSWNVMQPTNDAIYDIYYILAMKPTAFYPISGRDMLFALRIILRLSQCGLMSSLLLLNTYWCQHVEVLVDEGNFMSKSEMFMYWVFAGVVLVLPMAVLLGIGFGKSDWNAASNGSDVCLLLLGLVVIVGYILTCRRLQALERDSRNVNGGETSTTLQLAYYIYCVYWLLGSFGAIMILGVLYKFKLIEPANYPVLAQAINDLQGSLWSTLVIMVYPAAMFLLYPSVDVLTRPENDPGSRFQKRDKKSVKDAKRIRESLYLDGEASNSVENHSSLHGLTTRPSLTLQQQQHVQKQILHDQQQFINYRRERMGSLTAAVNEMQLIEEEESRAESIEMSRQLSASQKPSLEESQVAYKDRSWGDKTNETEYQYGSGTDSYMATNPNAYETKEGAKLQWMGQHIDKDRAGLIVNLEMTLPPDQQQPTYTWNKSPSPTMSPTSTYEISIPMDTTTTPSNADPSSGVPAPASAHATTTSSTSKSTPFKPPAPLTGILKTRNSTGSTRSSAGQNPFELATLASSRAPLSHVTPVYGARTSSVQPQTVASPRRSSENAPVKRRASNPSKSSSPTSNPVSDSPSPSPSVQQRRSNVTARVDASALALAALQQPFQHHPNLPSTPPFKSRSSRDGSEGVEIDYFGIQSAPVDTPYSTSTPNEIQQSTMSPPMTGFLMADPYPSAGTRFDQDISTTLSLSDSQEDMMAGIDSYSKRSGSSGSSKKYKAPPPPIPTGGSVSSSYRSTDFRSSIPTTPTTPTTPPGVRPRRSVDAVVDRRLLEMAGRMYEDHVVPAHILQSASAKSSPHSETPPTPTTSRQPQQPTEPVSPPPPRTMSPPLKSPHRVRESFENRAQGSQDPSTPPSPASTASPTIQSSSTLPRPLTPAWYESKTNFASTNEVLNHYNAVMRGGSFHKLEQQQQLQQQEQQQQRGGNDNNYYNRAVGPLDTVGPEYTYTQTPTIPAPVARPSIPQQYPLQERMGSADSFGVVRRSSSSRKPFESDIKPIAPPVELSLTHQVPHRLQPQVDRHSFMMPSESISVYSTWTGDLSDVTNTSGEVSVGAFADRKSSVHHHPKGSSGGSSDKGLTDHSDEHDVRKSHASAYSMGSSFGAGGSSPRQSAGGYSNYSNNSGPLNVSATLSSAGGLQHPQGSPSSSKRQSGPSKKRGSGSGSGSGHSSFTGSGGNGAAVIGTPIANKMNMMRLSAFGPGEEDVDVGPTRKRGSDAGVETSRDLYLEETDPTSEEMEKVIQQEWMDRRAAVKKDSKNRLEQLQKQQALEDQRREKEQREQEQRQQVQEENPAGRRRQEHMEEPYSLNSVYFKSSAELELGLSDPSLSSSSAMVSTVVAEPSYMFARQAQNISSSHPETSGESVTASSVTTVTTPTTAVTTPSPHPSQPSSRPPTVSPTQPFFPSPTLSRTDIQTQDNLQGAHDEEMYIRSPTYGSPYANHQNQLYYDSVDSIATLRDNRGAFSSPSGVPGQFQHRHQLSASSSPAPIGPVSAAPSPTPSFSSASQRYQRYQQQQSAVGSTSPTPLSSYPVYQHTLGSPASPRSAGSPSPQSYYTSSSPHSPTGVSLTVLGPSQYRITTAAGGEGMPGSPGHPSEDGDDVGSRSRSPVRRTSSRMTNLTNAESEYQWESAELNHHRWEMLENANTHHRK